MRQSTAVVFVIMYTRFEVGLWGGCSELIDKIKFIYILKQIVRKEGRLGVMADIHSRPSTPAAPYYLRLSFGSVQRLFRSHLR